MPIFVLQVDPRAQKKPKRGTRKIKRWWLREPQIIRLNVIKSHDSLGGMPLRPREGRSISKYSRPHPKEKKKKKNGVSSRRNKKLSGSTKEKTEGALGAPQLQKIGKGKGR